MKRIIAVPTAAVMAMCLSGCGENAELTVENNVSQIYSEEDLSLGLKTVDVRMDGIQAQFDRVSYLGDEYCTNKEVLENINRLEKREERGLEEYTECIGFSVDAHFPKTPDVLLERINDGDCWAYIRSSKVEDLNVLYARVGDGDWEEVFVGDHDILTHFDRSDRK